jgi:DNA-binding NtrC family response regulator
VRGTIVLVGHKNRTMDLLAARLEKEHYTVVATEPGRRAFSAIAHNAAQAVLCSATCSPKFLTRLSAATRKYKPTRFSPIIVVGESEASPELATLSGIGEIWRLHSIPLSKAMQRLELAIQLMHLNR